MKSLNLLGICFTASIVTLLGSQSVAKANSNCWDRGVYICDSSSGSYGQRGSGRGSTSGRDSIYNQDTGDYLGSISERDDVCDWVRRTFNEDCDYGYYNRHTDAHYVSVGRNGNRRGRHGRRSGSDVDIIIRIPSVRIRF